MCSFHGQVANKEIWNIKSSNIIMDNTNNDDNDMPQGLLSQV